MGLIQPPVGNEAFSGLLAASLSEGHKRGAASPLARNGPRVPGPSTFQAEWRLPYTHGTAQDYHDAETF